MQDVQMEVKEELREKLETAIGELKSVVVGYSAGVDSTVVAAAAHASLGSRALAVTAATESITREDLELAQEIAAARGWSYEQIEYSEIEINGYSENPANRCFFCKNALYSRLSDLARERGFNYVLDGTNLDDLGDYRPGLEAARQLAVRSPLAELEFDKLQVRSLARSYNLPNHDKPSAPCLSSRVPYGTRITRQVLDQIAAAERALRELGFRELRVRHHDDVARIEVPKGDFERALVLADEVDSAVRQAGYRFVSLDLRGYRSGALNESLTQIELPGSE